MINRIEVGYVNEKHFRRARIDVSELISGMTGTYTVTILHQRKGDTSPYPVSGAVLDGNVLTWTFDAVDTAVQGYGEARVQVTSTDGTVIGLSKPIVTVVGRGVGATGATPTAGADWATSAVATVNAKSAAAASSASSASASASSAAASAASVAAVATTVNQIVDAFNAGTLKGDTGATGATGAAGADGRDGRDGVDGTNGVDGNDGSDGLDGYSPTVAITDITGGHRVTITDVNGDHSYDVMDGQTGATGATGAAGSDASVTESNINAALSLDLKAVLRQKQDTISDLSTIRSGAAAGATALQSVKTINGQSLVGTGDITIGGDSEWVLKATMTDANTLNIDLSGCTELMLVGTVTGTAASNLTTNISGLAQNVSSNGSRKILLYYTTVNGCLMPIQTRYGGATAAAMTSALVNYMWVDKSVSDIVQIYWATASAITSCDIKIYAR